MLEESGEPLNQLIWTDELIKKFWNWQTENNSANYLSRQVGDQIAKVVRQYVPNGSTIFDFGAGNFGMKEHLQDYHVWCYEPSVGRIILPPVSIDAVLMIDVIEHMDERAGADALSVIRKIIDSNGVLIITTDNDEDLRAKSVYCPSCDKSFHPMQHQRSFSEASLREELEANGFEVVDSYTTSWWMMKSKAWHVKLGFLAKWIFGRKLENLVCIARKK